MWKPNALDKCCATELALGLFCPYLHSVAQIRLECSLFLPWPLIVWEPRSPRFPETISLNCSWSPLVGSSHSLSSTGTWPWSVSVQISGLFIWMVGKALCIPDWLGHTECWDYGYEPHFVHNSFFHKNTRPRVLPDLNLGGQSRSILRKII